MYKNEASFSLLSLEEFSKDMRLELNLEREADVGKVGRKMDTSMKQRASCKSHRDIK